MSKASPIVIGEPERLLRLLALSEALVPAASADEISAALAEWVVPGLGATRCCLCVLSDDGEYLELSANRTMSTQELLRWRRVRTDAALATCEVARTGQPLFITPAELEARFGPSEASQEGNTWAIVPLVGRRGKVGVLGFGVPGSRPFSDDQKELVFAAARQAGLCLERAKLFRGERLARLESESVLDTLSAAFDASPLAMVLIDESGRVLRWSAAAERIFGWTAQEVLGQRIPTIPVDAAEEFRAQMQTTLAGTGMIGAETVRRRKNGELFPAQLWTAKVQLAGGARAGLGILSDLTERHEQAKAMGELLERVQAAHRDADAQRETLKRLFADFPEPLVVLRGEELRFELVNTRFRTVVQREVLGHPAREILPEANAQGWWDIAEQVLKSGTRFVAYDAPVQVTFPDGEAEAYFNVVVQPLPAGPDGVPGVLMVGNEVTDQVLARRQIEAAQRISREAEERLRLALDAAAVGIFDWDLRNNVVTWDERAKEIFGRQGDAGPFRLEDFRARVHPADLPGQKFAMERALASEDGRYEYTYRVIPADGSPERWIQARGRARFENGEPVRFMGTLLDVTAQKKLERERDLAAQRFESLARASAQVIWTADAQGNGTNPSHSWCSFTGQSPQAMLGEGWIDQVHPEDRLTVSVLWRSAVQARRPYEARFRLRRADGSYAHTLARGVPVFNEDGTVREWVGSCADVTEERRAEDAREQLRRIERTAAERARTLARASEVLSSSLDYELTLKNVISLALPTLGDFGFFDVVEGKEVRRISLAFNDVKLQECINHTRWVKSERTDMNLCALSTGQSAFHPEIDDRWYRAVAQGPDELRGMRGLGFCSMISVPMVFENRVQGSLTLFFAGSGRHHTLEDLSLSEELARLAGSAVQNSRLYRDLKRSEDRAQKAYLAASEAERRKDEFLAVLGHELRNPLGPILTALQLMELKGEGDHARERTLIERQVRHLTRLVDDLLDVSRIARGKVQLAKEPLELHDGVTKALELVGPVLQARGHAVQVSVPREGLLLSADPARLAQVVSNLLDNAAKYTPPGGRISVGAERRDDTVALTVTDSGCGIAPELLPSVFDAFVQGDGAADRANGGLGIGLTIVKRLVELHGGTVKAESAGPGLGAAFTVTFPAMQARPREEKGRAVPVPGVRARKVLIVDDNRDAAEVLAEALEALGHQTRIAFDAPSGLVAVVEFAPDLAVLDLGLPAMDGFELARRIQETLARPPVLVALTGYGQESDRARTRAAGFAEHLVKPIELSALRGIIDRLDELPPL